MAGPAIFGRRGSTRRSTVPGSIWIAPTPSPRPCSAMPPSIGRAKARLRLGIDRASVAGVEAKQADVTMRIDPNGIDVERLAIAELDGATVMVTGRIATKARAPHGAVTIDVEARALDGVLALVEKIAPQAADPLQAGRGTADASPDASLARASTPARPQARRRTRGSRVGGHAGALRVALRGDVSVAGDAKIENLAALAAAKVHINGQLDADDGASARRADRDRPSHRRRKSTRPAVVLGDRTARWPACSGSSIHSRGARLCIKRHSPAPRRCRLKGRDEAQDPVSGSLSSYPMPISFHRGRRPDSVPSNCHLQSRRGSPCPTAWFG